MTATYFSALPVNFTRSLLCLLLLNIQVAVAAVDMRADFNADGFEDIAIGVPGEDIDGVVDAGAVQVFYGSSSGITTSNQFWHLNSPGIPLEAEANDRFGSAMAAGDFNHDGFADLAIGIPFKKFTQGKVLVIYGSSSGLSATSNQVWDQNILADAPEWDDRFGSALAAGDFDADGYSDLIIGVPGEDFVDVGSPNFDPPRPKCSNYPDGECPNAGIAHLIFGGPTGLQVHGNELWHQDRRHGVGWLEWQDCSGASLTVGDFDGNGADDLVLGAPCEHTGGADVTGMDPGGVKVFYGRPGVGLTESGADYLRQWAEGAKGYPQSGDAFAYSLAATDIDGDGFDDLVIGTPGEEQDTVSGNTDAGAVAIFYGAASYGLSVSDASRNELWSKSAVGLGNENAGAHWGWSVATGDFNADGFGDVAVSAPQDSVSGVTEAGTVSILFGGAARISSTGNQLVSQDTPGIVDAAEGRDWFGYSLRAGDFNGDGVSDLAVGTPFEDLGGITNMGAVNLIYGASGIGLSTTANHLIHQNNPNILDNGEPWDEFGGRLVPKLKTNPWPDRPADDGGSSNMPPELALIAAQTVMEGELLKVTVSASDTDGPGPLQLTATNLPSGASFVDFGNGNGEFNWVPLTGAAASSPYSVTFTATEDGGAGLSDSEVVSLTVILASAGEGVLSGAMAMAPSSVNLTNTGPNDWVHWTLNGATDINRKAGVSPQISDFTPVGGAVGWRVKSMRTSYVWGDGSPRASVSNAKSAFGLFRPGKGIEFTVPADTTTRTLRVYVGAADGAQGRLEASLSDGGALPYSTVIYQASGKRTREVTLSYQAASPGQQLIIRYVVERKDNAAVGFITLAAATLQGGATINQPPTLNMIGPQTVMEGQALTIPASASDADGPGPLQLTATNLPSGATFANVGNGSGEFNWVPLTGTAANSPYSVTFTATEDGGAGLSDSEVVSITVIPASTEGGALSGAMVMAPNSVNLSNMGSNDWIHWTLNSATDINRKVGVNPQISDFAPVGGAVGWRVKSMRTSYAWSDGAPRVSASYAKSAFALSRVGRGVEFTVPADTTTRTLHLYVGAADGAQGQLKASLSDGSALPYSTAIYQASGKRTREVTLSYQAASPGQQLIIRYVVERKDNPAAGFITLSAAAL